ncbi:hypothetical protein P171DRAFT_405638 [Karstenula rhodostoma CBS 690.94]|uniref:Serine hydrolase domain-containing protein n=1 Tax=Karstenula rhodostoma CBS 690.94 TaxID=1392251 RepID=A0A9P4PTN0_9PLEO|nr:hypothetical protein P171DRAFT_405638 [Karstenula rhodostoma CBS 690.94]
MAKPTLLAFHGSGSNDTIHIVQLARISRFLKPHFEIEALCGPIMSDAGPGILPFFDGCGPFYRWAPASEVVTASTTTEYRAMLPEVSNLVEAAVARARTRGSKVVGVIGFSQGTRVVAGLLKAAQILRELKKEGKGDGLDWLDIRFALSVCSSFPPPLVPAAVIEAVRSSGLDEARQKDILEARIRLPALHVLGIQDEWKWAGKLLVESAYEADVEPQSVVEQGRNGVYEFNMGHHYPVQPEDTQRVADWVLGTWEGVKGE